MYVCHVRVFMKNNEAWCTITTHSCIYLYADVVELHETRQNGILLKYNGMAALAWPLCLEFTRAENGRETNKRMSVETNERRNERTNDQRKCMSSQNKFPPCSFSFHSMCVSVCNNNNNNQHHHHHDVIMYIHVHFPIYIYTSTTQF